MCSKCGKSLSTAENLSSLLENFHKYKNYICITCQHATQYKKNMVKHMKNHPEWVAHPELRCHFCINNFHNKDGFHQHVKEGKHNPHRVIGQFMCRTLVCGSVFTLLRKKETTMLSKAHDKGDLVSDMTSPVPNTGNCLTSCI